jgi:hypothetical protein
MEEARRTIVELVQDNVATVDDEPDPDYGFDLLGVNTPTITPRSLNWFARVGGRFGDSINFEAGFIGTPPDPEIVTYDLLAVLSLGAACPGARSAF